MKRGQSEHKLNKVFIEQKLLLNLGSVSYVIFYLFCLGVCPLQLKMLLIDMVKRAKLTIVVYHLMFEGSIYGRIFCSTNLFPNIDICLRFFEIWSGSVIGNFGGRESFFAFSLVYFLLKLSNIMNIWQSQIFVSKQKRHLCTQ